MSLKQKSISETLTVQEDPETGELYLVFPQPMLDRVGWKEGDVIEWIDNKDGSWSLEKKSV